MPSLSITPVDGILEEKGREEFAGAHPFYSKSKHKFNTEKKGYREVFSKQKMN